MGLRKTTESFINDAIRVHTNKYDYSKVNYVNNRTKVCIICPEHGEFWQTPHEHLDGCICPLCAKNNRAAKKRKSTETFIQQANEVHKNKYDYSKVNYSNANSSLTIICPKHGEFKMIPANHLKGQGCPKCGNLNKGNYQKSNTQDFIKKSKLVHGDKYDYSKVDYKNNRIKVTIICPLHGEFLQKPLDHLHGSGCPECGKKFGIAEKQVLKALKEKYENVEYQYPPKWLKSKTSPQTLDFYLPKYNIGIEYQGRQHFYSNKKFGGDEEFEKNIKKRYT